MSGLGVIPLIWPIGAAAAAVAGLWFNSQENDQRELENERARLEIARQKLQPNSTNTGEVGAMLPAAAVLAVVSLMLIARR